MFVVIGCMGVRAVVAGAECQDERLAVLVAKGAIEQEIASGVKSYEEIENVAESAEKGLFILGGRVKNLVDEN